VREICEIPGGRKKDNGEIPTTSRGGLVNHQFEPHINLIEIFRPKWKQYQKQTHFREKNEKIENLLTFVRSTNVIKRNF
jgi:hypothetical protein